MTAAALGMTTTHEPNPTHKTAGSVSSARSRGGGGGGGGDGGGGGAAAASRDALPFSVGVDVIYARYFSGATNVPSGWETAPGEGYKNPWVGFSSLYFAAPAFAARSDYEALLWLALALISCWSDCDTGGVDSVCHALDRWYAPFMFVRANLLLLVVNWNRHPFVWLVAMVSPAVLAFYYSIKELKKARADGAGGNRERWAFYHIVWHILGSTGGLYTTWQAKEMGVECSW